MKEIVKFSTLGLTDDEKTKVLKQINELRKRRNYEEYYLDFYINYNYFTFNTKNCEITAKFKDFSEFKKQKVRIVNPVEYFLKDENNNDFENKIDEIFKDMKELLIKKHHDYGNSNLEKYGEFGILVRMSDKLSRLEQKIVKNKELQTDSHEDIYKDLIGYATQALILLKQKEGETE